MTHPFSRGFAPLAAKGELSWCSTATPFIDSRQKIFLLSFPFLLWKLPEVCAWWVIKDESTNIFITFPFPFPALEASRSLRLMSHQGWVISNCMWKGTKNKYFYCLPTWNCMWRGNKNKYFYCLPTWSCMWRGNKTNIFITFPHEIPCSLFGPPLEPAPLYKQHLRCSFSTPGGLT